MKKRLLGASIAILIGLTGCGDKDADEELKIETPTARAASRILFDPANGVLPVPSDLLFALAAQSQDGTLEMPDEVAGKASAAGVDFGNPSAALGRLMAGQLNRLFPSLPLIQMALA